MLWGSVDAGRVFGGRRVCGVVRMRIACLAVVGLRCRGVCGCAVVRFVGRARHADAVVGRSPGWYGCGHEPAHPVPSCPAGYDSSGCEHPFPHRAGRGLSAVMWLHGCVRHTVLFCPILPAFWLVSSGCEHPSPFRRRGMFFRSVGCGIAGLRGANMPLSGCLPIRLSGSPDNSDGSVGVLGRRGVHGVLRCLSGGRGGRRIIRRRAAVSRQSCRPRRGYSQGVPNHAGESPSTTLPSK